MSGTEPSALTCFICFLSAMILLYDANLGWMEFSETTGRPGLRHGRSGHPDIRLAILCGDLTFHYDLGLKTFEVAKDRGNCKHASIALKAEDAIFAHHVAID